MKYSLLFFLLFIACSKDNDYKSDVFKYNEHKNIGSLDPAFAKDNADIWAVNQLFNGLVQMDEDLNVIPCVAQSWEVSEDAKTFTFLLRNDVKFHPHERFGSDSTRVVTASDVVYSLERLRDKKLASPGSWVLQHVDEIKALNDTILEIDLKRAFPAFLGLLTMKYCSVVPKEIVDYYGTEFRSNPIGTGPFKLKRWEENIKLVMRRNPHYFEVDTLGDSLPYLEAVAITFLPDKQSEFLQFAQGNIDFVSGLDGSYKDEILTSDGKLRAKYEDRVTMIRGPYLNTEYLGFYLDSEVPEIQSRKLRMAVNFGFDRTTMMTYLRNGIGIPANGGFIPKGLPGHKDHIGFKYDPERSKQLIQDYIKDTGDQEPEITLTTTSNYLSFCEYIQRELEKSGLRIIIDVVPASALKESKANGKTDLFRASWVADYPDAENYLSLFYSNNFAPNGPNYTHYQNPSFDLMYDEALTETQTEAREMIYSKMDSMVISEAPVVPLFYDEVVRFTSHKIKGLGINPINLLELKRVKKMELDH